MKVTEGKFFKKAGFRMGKGCMDQMFGIKKVVKELLFQCKKLFAAFLDLQNANKFDKEVLWNVPKVNGVGGQLLEEIKAFYKKRRASVRVEG